MLTERESLKQKLIYYLPDENTLQNTDMNAVNKIKEVIVPDTGVQEEDEASDDKKKINKSGDADSEDKVTYDDKNKNDISGGDGNKPGIPGDDENKLGISGGDDK